MQPIPINLEAIDPAWLTGVLRDAGVLLPDQRIVGLRMRRGAGGIAATSFVSRIVLTLAPPAGTALRSLFAKIPKPTHASLADHGREVWFYAHMASRLSRFVPRCYHAAIDAEAHRGVILLEDLTDVRPGHPNAGCSEAETALILRRVADLHRLTWQADPGAAPDWLRFAVDADRAVSLVRRFRDAWPAFRRQTLYPVPDAVADRLGTVGDDAFIASRRRYSEPPLALTHGDLHTENLLIQERARGRPRVWLFDWQDVALANPAVDYSSVLIGMARVEVQAGAGTRLLEGYHAALGPEIQATYPFARLLADHRAVLPWKLLGAVLFLAGYTATSAGEHRVLRGEWERMCAGYLGLD